MQRARSIGPVLSLLVALATLATLAGPATGQTFDLARIGQGQGAGARAMGMGGAFSAVSDDATAVTWNPAGGGEVEKPTVSVTYAPFSRLRWEHPAREIDTWRLSGYRESAESRPFDSASAALPFKVGSRTLVALAGYQRVVDLGFERDFSYDYGWIGDGAPAGTYPNSFQYTSNEAGGLDVYSAGLGLKLGGKLALGVTVERWTGDALAKSVEQDQAGGAQALGQTTLDQSYSGFGFRGGVLLLPNPKLRLAAVVRAPFKMTHEWSATTALVADVYSLSQDTQKDGSFDLPLAATLGVAYKPVSGLTLTGDVTLARWKDAVYSHTYTSVVEVQQFGQPDQRTESRGERRQTWPLYGDPDVADDPGRQSDTLQSRLGLEYVVRLGEHFSLPLRVGGFLDQQLVQDELGDAVQLKGLTAGLGLRVPYAAVDLAWAYESGVSAYKTSGDLEQSSHRLCLSVTLRP